MEIIYTIAVVYLGAVVIAFINGYFSGNFMWDMERGNRLKNLSKQ